MHKIDDISILFQNTHNISNESNSNVMCQNGVKWNLYSVWLEMIQMQEWFSVVFFLAQSKINQTNDIYGLIALFLN